MSVVFVVFDVMATPVGTYVDAGHVQLVSGSAHDVAFRHRALVLPPQSLHVRLYHCSVCSEPTSAAGPAMSTELSRNVDHAGA